jgi:hypothetical protein
VVLGFVKEEEKKREKKRGFSFKKGKKSRKNDGAGGEGRDGW